MPQLDSLRTAALLLVLAYHFLDLGKLPYGFGQIWWGGIGVYLFFILSGFLITRILLRCREAMDNSEASGAFAARQFYARRFLRIFPLYYALIGFGFLSGLSDARSHWKSLATFTFNSALARTGWVPHYTPFWSLSVEEQFYLFWPCCILLVPRRWLTCAAGSLILVGCVWRLAGDLLNWNEIARNCATLGCVDLLGAGALLAVISRTKTAWDRMHTILSWTAPLAVIAALAFSMPFLTKLHHAIWFTWAGVSFWAVALTWVVSGAARGFGGIAGACLNVRVVQYIGKISYCIYACHLFVAYAVAKVLGQDPTLRGPSKFLLVTAVSVLVAAISWKFFEAPVNGLKRFFPYVPHHENILAGSVAASSANTSPLI
jgi:peptidoglycan/LPS O-acetylase OafA/YrhL